MGYLEAEQQRLKTAYHELSYILDCLDNKTPYESWVMIPPSSLYVAIDPALWTALKDNGIEDIADFVCNEAEEVPYLARDGEFSFVADPEGAKIPWSLLFTDYLVLARLDMKYETKDLVADRGDNLKLNRKLDELQSQLNKAQSAIRWLEDRVAELLKANGGK